MFADTSGAGGWGTFVVPHQCVVSLHYGIFRRGALQIGVLGLNVMGCFLLNRTLKEMWEGGVSG